jgi:DNA-binding transcriptional ArsR family regulator
VPAGPLRGVLWWLLAGSRGGENRGRLIQALRERPRNANQLSELLGLDYKTVRHHLDVLAKNGVATAVGGDQYGAVWMLTAAMEAELPVFDDIWAKVGPGSAARPPGGKP